MVQESDCQYVQAVTDSQELEEISRQSRDGGNTWYQQNYHKVQLNTTGKTDQKSENHCSLTGTITNSKFFYQIVESERNRHALV